MRWDFEAKGPVIQSYGNRVAQIAVKYEHAYEKLHLSHSPVIIITSTFVSAIEG